MSANCSDCRHFQADPASIEAAFPGLSSLSSAYSSVRGDAGLCLRRDLFVAPSKRCEDFAPYEEARLDESCESCPW